MFDRLKLLISEESFLKIENKKILVVGLGGVGGECVISLIRSGIQNIVLIDYDVVDITNLNRQVVAYQSTIGKKKTEVLEMIIKDINPEVKVKLYNIFLDDNNLKEVIEIEKPDYIIDCCDTVATKKAIIKESIKNNIKFISSMGTGNKLNPSKLEVTDISKTVNCPLAKVMRKWARDEKIKEKITVVYSSELPLYKGTVVASSAFVPNSAGLLISSYVIKDLIK